MEDIKSGKQTKPLTLSDNVSTVVYFYTVIQFLSYSNYCYFDSNLTVYTHLLFSKNFSFFNEVSVRFQHKFRHFYKKKKGNEKKIENLS